MEYNYKKIAFNLSMFLAMLILIPGCKTDFLDSSNPNQITEQTFWKTENDVQGAVAAAYSPLRLPLYSYWGAFTGFQDINAIGDDVVTIPGEEPATWQIATFTNDPNNGDASNTFKKMYMTIYRANLVIANIDKVPLEPAKKSSYLGEVKFLRGLSYFILVSNYGDVPLRLKPVESSEDQFIPSSKAEDVWKQVMADFTEASTLLPTQRPEKEYGRATSGAALAYLGKSYLFQKDYPNAETTLAKLKQNPYNYSLLTDYGRNFTNQNKTNNPEAVFQWVYGPFGDPTNPWAEEQQNSGMYQYFAQLIGPPGGGGWFKYVPDVSVVKAYMEEPRTMGSDTKFDKRMYASLFWKHSEFGEPDVTWYGGSNFDQLWSSARPKIDRLYPAFNHDTTTYGRFLIRKMTNSWSAKSNADNYWGPTPSDANYIIMRYAEVLLMHAEAAIQNGNLGAALTDLNAIRNRAGLVSKTTTDLPDKSSMMAEMKHQKLLEFFFEQKRWDDLKRWYEPAELKQHFIQKDKQGANSFQPKNYTFPIPSEEIQTNNAVVQNPLWQ